MLIMRKEFLILLELIYHYLVMIGIANGYQVLLLTKIHGRDLQIQIDHLDMLGLLLELCLGMSTIYFGNRHQKDGLHL